MVKEKTRRQVLLKLDLNRIPQTVPREAKRKPHGKIYLQRETPEQDLMTDGAAQPSPDRGRPAGPPASTRREARAAAAPGRRDAGLFLAS